MYVIADLEWVESSTGIKSPTQLAALRVDGDWNVTDRFDSFIQPMDQSFYKWDHVAYAGGSEDDFIFAPSCRSVFDTFDSWLGADTLLWWFSPAKELYEASARLFLNKCEPSPSILLGDRVTRFLYGGNPKRIGSYKLAEMNGIDRPFPEHYAVNDVELLLALIRGIGFPQLALTETVERGKGAHNLAARNKGAYQYDVCGEIWHKKGCSLLAASAEVIGSDSLNACIRSGERACSCVRKEVAAARRERMDDIISRSIFTFGYAVGGNVFHHYTCRLLRNAREILGCVTYEKVAEKGLRPCRVCNPSPENSRRPGVPYPVKKAASSPQKKSVSKSVSKPARKKPQKPRKADAAVNRRLTDAESVALIRLRQAQRERLSGAPTDVLLEKEKDDFYTLTQPRFAFFAAKGYRTFHSRSCNKLSGIIGVRGFETYEAAQKSGFKPCKNCRPSPKQNIVVSIPIDNEVRENESVTELTLCCVKLGYEYNVENSKFHIVTPVGKWILNMNERPVTVEHINLVKEPGCTVYHRQHRIFLSLRDALRYIHRHDATLQGVYWDAGAV